MKERLKFDKNRKKAKKCPCGKSNTNQKFAPFEGYDNFGFCFSCEKTFLPEKGTVSQFIPQSTNKENHRQQISYHDNHLLVKSFNGYGSNKFVQFLKNNFSKHQVNTAIKRYRIGSSKHWAGATIFWQIDNNNKIRHGKIMLYDAKTGKRVKSNDGRAYISSVRAVLKLKEFELQQCLFGLHLIKVLRNKTIAIVEGEKTAILMSIFKPEYIWMATGSKQGFKIKSLNPIKDYNIVAFPDKGEHNDWQQKALQFNKLGFQIVVDDWLESLIEYPKGSDLADIYLFLSRNSPVSTVEAQMVKTISETKVNFLSRINPSIWTLIEAFDLIDENGHEIKKFHATK